MAESPASILRFDHVTVRFDDYEALSDVSFDAFEGEARVIFGAAGSGKTVLLKTALGLVKPDSGKVYAFGGTSGNQSVPVASVERYDPGVDSWSSITTMPTPRCRMALSFGPAPSDQSCFASSSASRFCCPSASR